MYIKIKDLQPEEAKAIKDMFKDRAEIVYSIYHEVCKIEADCSLERVLDELGITLNEEEINEAIEEIAEELANACEDTAFQEMCERADEIATRYLS